MKNRYTFLFCISFLGLLALFSSGCQQKQEKQKIQKPIPTTTISPVLKKDSSLVDTADYNKRVHALKHTDTSGKWKNKAPYPLPGAILPYKRVIAFYGNLYSKRMGILGELPKDQMLQKLQQEAAQWELADKGTPSIPALHYIAITAQGQPGKNNKYRLRMPFSQIDTIMTWAKSINGLVFLDVQIGQSTVKEEVSTLIDYLKKPNVHLGIDPEFAMKNGKIPGSKIGTLSANEINEAIDILIKIVKENHLPPKIVVIHRFTKAMVTDYQNIKTSPEVQIVMNMDGFGSKALKRATYQRAIYAEPVQFTGFKLFYKNDTKNGQSLYTPEELLQFTPKPIYIQYQ
jgi:hypothetical protein